MDKTGFKSELGSALDKIAHMKPVPPNDNLNDPTWGKVDKLIKRLLNFLKEDSVSKPMDVLQCNTFDLACSNLAPPVQTIAWRALDTWLLIYESRRIRGIVASKDPLAFCRPSHPVYIPPSVGESIYLEGATDALKIINGKLRERGIIKPPPKNRGREGD